MIFLIGITHSGFLLLRDSRRFTRMNLIRYHHLDSRLSSNRLKDDRSVYGCGARRRNVSSRVRDRCQWVLLSYCYNPGYYPADAGNGKGKGKRGRRGQIDRVVSSLRQTATWPIRFSPKVSSTLTDLSTGDRLFGQSLSLSLFLRKFSDSYTEFGLKVHTLGRTFPSQP